MQLNLIHCLIFFLFIFLIIGCNPKHSQIDADKSAISLSEQLTGIGKIGTHPDSLKDYFCFFPVPDSVENIELYYKLWHYPKLMGDTIQFRLMDIYSLINDIEDNFYSIFHDSIQYTISKSEDEVFLFTLISDYSFAPKALYFRLLPNKLPKEFTYYRHCSQSSRLGMVDIELVSNNFVKIMTSSGHLASDSIVLHQISLKDYEIVVQFLNGLIEERQTLIDNGISSMFGTYESIDLVYNDSIFSFNHIQSSVIPQQWLTHYFLANPPKIHSYMDQKDTTYKERFKPFSKFPYGNEFEEKWLRNIPEN